MKQASSMFTGAMSRAWKRLPLSARLAVGVVVTAAAILLNVAVDQRSDAPAAANAAVTAPVSGDPSVPDASQALSGEERQQEPPVPTF